MPQRDLSHLLAPLAELFEQEGDRAAETVYMAAVAMLERAAVEARESHGRRWRVYPKAELRQLRRDVALAMRLARTACAIHEVELARDEAMYAELRAAAEEAGRARRRAQTLPAELARLAKAKARSGVSALPNTGSGSTVVPDGTSEVVGRGARRRSGAGGISASGSGDAPIPADRRFGQPAE